MIDINHRALELAKKNVDLNQLSNCTIFESDGFSNVNNCFNYIVTNPPIRAGKQLVHSFFEGAYRYLHKDGELLVVIQKKQGAESAVQKIRNIFGNVQILEKKAGYQIIHAKKLE